MNTTLNLDDLKQRWTAQDPLLDRSLRLNVDLLRENLAGKAAANLAPQKRMKWFELLCHLAMIVWLSGFALQHLAEPRLAVPALLCDLFYIGIAALDVHHRRLLARLDFSAAIGAVQTRIEALRGLRLRTAKWIFLSAPMLWIPLSEILFKSLFGVDLYANVSTSYWIISLAFALAWIPLFLLAVQFCARRFAHTPRFQELLDSIAGPGIASTRRFGDLLAEFDSAQAGDLPRAVHAALADRHSAGVCPAPPRITALQAIAQDQSRRLLVGIGVLAASLFGTGSLMAMHGGEVALIVPALILHLGIVATMVTLIRQRIRIGALDVAAAPAAIRHQLTEFMNARVDLARMLLGLLPAIAIALVLLAAQIAADPVIGTQPGWGQWTIVGIAILGGCAVAYRLAMRRVPRVGESGSVSTFGRWIRGKDWQTALSTLDAESRD